MRIASPLHLERITAPSNQFFVLRRFPSPYFPFLWHYHPEVELTLIRRGRGLRYIGHSVEPFQEGDLCLLGGNLPHTWSSDRNITRVESTCIQFLPETGGAPFWQLRELREITRLFQQAKGGFSIEGNLRRQTRERLDALEKLPLVSPRRVSLFLEILALLAANARKMRPLHPGTRAPAGARPGRGEALLQKVLREVEANSSREIVHRDMAKLVGFSPPAFCRFFKRQMGRTFSDHVNDVRLARACAELADTDRGITEIAFGCGYNNLPHFNRRFRAMMNCTPREYRRRALQGAAAAN
jgi:AraC-like DNA-binding protein